MAFETCLTYLRRRGKLPFRAASFGPVDNLILSLCAYDPFEWVLPGVESGVWLTFPRAVDKLTQKPGWDDVGVLMSPHTPELVVETARSPRFRSLALGCMETVSDQDTQFAALTYRLPDGTLFLAFRGTDDTLAGWKECFAMSYSPTVPSQRLALDYLVRVAAKYPGKLRLGGHSKGGNLAVWAAVHAPALIRRRILMVYSNDGPGFHRDLTHTPTYRALAPRIVTYVPQASLVGALLHQDPRARTVKSHGRGTAGQHDPFTWEVHSGSFRFLPRRSRQAQREADGFQGWVDSMAPAEREEFTEVLFSLLSAAQAKTLSELSEHWADTALAALGAYRALPPETRRDMLNDIWRFLRNLSTGGKAHAHRLH